MDRKLYECIKCHYNSYTRQHYLRHLNTRKHLINHNEKVAMTVSMCECPKCGKKYSHRSGLYRHTKACNVGMEEIQVSDSKHNRQIQQTEPETQKATYLSSKQNNQTNNMANQNCHIETQNQIGVIEEQKNIETNIENQNLKVVNINFSGYSKDPSKFTQQEMMDFLNRELKDLLSIEEYGKMLYLGRIELGQLVNAYEAYKVCKDCEDRQIRTKFDGLRSVYADILQDNYVKIVKTQPRVFPVICGDSQVRHFKIKEMNEWASKSKVEEIQPLIKIINDQVRDMFDYLIKLDDTESRNVAKFIIRGHPFKKLAQLQSYLPLEEVRRNHKKSQRLIKDSNILALKDVPFCDNPKIEKLCRFHKLIHCDPHRHMYYVNEPEPFGGYNDIHAKCYYLNFSGNHYKVRETTLVCKTVEGNHFVGYYIHSLHMMITNVLNFYEDSEDILYTQRISDDLKILEQSNGVLTELDCLNKIGEIIENLGYKVEHDKIYLKSDRRKKLYVPYSAYNGDYLPIPVIVNGKSLTCIYDRNTNYIYKSSRFMGMRRKKKNYNFSESDDEDEMYEILLKERLSKEYKVVYENASF
jgi:hypothetical protein